MRHRLAVAVLVVAAAVTFAQDVDAMNGNIVCANSTIGYFDLEECLKDATVDPESDPSGRWLCSACAKILSAQCRVCNTDPQSTKCALCQRFAPEREVRATRLMQLGCHTFCLDEYGAPKECGLPVCGEFKCPPKLLGEDLVHSKDAVIPDLGNIVGPDDEAIEDCANALCKYCPVTLPV